jgi:predicted transcriptional regulator
MSLLRSSVLLDADLKKRMSIIAAQRRLSISEAIRLATKEFVKQNESK